jgi:hypothetical protein
LDVLLNVPLSTIVQYVAPELIFSKMELAFATKMDADLWLRHFKFPNDCNPFAGNSKFASVNVLRVSDKIAQHTSLADLGVPSSKEELAFNLQLLSMRPLLLYRNSVKSLKDASTVVWRNTAGELFDAKECHGSSCAAPLRHRRGPQAQHA